MGMRMRIGASVLAVAVALCARNATPQPAPLGSPGGASPAPAAAPQKGAPAPQPTTFRLPPPANRTPAVAASAARLGRDEAVGQLVGSRMASAVSRTRVPVGSAEPPLLVRTDEGWVRAVGAIPGEAFAAARAGLPAEPGETAAAFLLAHKTAFGVGAEGTAFRAERVKGEGSRRFVRLRQEVRGLPVYGASAVVQIDAAGDVEFAVSDVVRDDARVHREGFSFEPSVPARDARARAERVPAHVPDGSGLETSEPVLMIYEPSVIGNFGTSRLVWHVEVTSRTLPVDELILVDARSGEVAFHFSQIMEAKNRAIYDCNNIPGWTGALARSEGQGATGLADVDLAYQYLGDTYDYYWSRFGRDSIDGAGMALVARTYYCQSSSDCPMQNAYWYSDINEMRFGQGFAAADDVVAHELTHGVTSRESNLIYWGESGAINESLSDIFGEFVDLSNGSGTDTPAVRWKMGEDAPGGAIRSMQDPTLYNNPDRRYSPYWWTLDGDRRGVHINSGVGNKLAYLLVDGATFNGQTVTGMGLDPVAALFYEAQVNLLGPGHDYVDLYSVLKQAAVNRGWNDEARANLERACRAVEIAVPANVATLFSDGFEGAFPGAWAVYDVSGVGTQWGRSTFLAFSGSGSAWCAAGGALARPAGGTYAPNMNTWLVAGPFSLSDAAKAWAEFDLWLDVEPQSPTGVAYDGVAWGVSVDGSLFYLEDVSPPSGGMPDPYTGAHELFDFRNVGGVNVIGQPQVWIAFRFYSDSSVQHYGAYLDNVVIKKAVCAAPSSPSLSSPTSAQSGAGSTVSWSATSPIGTYEIQESTDPAFGTASTWPWNSTSAVFTRTVADDTIFYYRARATDSCGGSTYASSWSNVGQTVVRAPRALAISKAGTGLGTVTSEPAGVSCGAVCAASFDYGTVVTLSATAGAGSSFTGWSGEGCSGTGTCQVTMSQARNVAATFTMSTASRYYAVTPCRVVDTRNVDGPLGGPILSAATTRAFTIGGSCGIPADATGVSINVTVSQASTPGSLTLFPGTGAVPNTTAISFVAGRDRANNAILGLTGGALSVRDNQTTGTVHFIIDVNGYFE